MSGKDNNNSVLFGNFSSDEIQDLYKAGQSAVMFLTAPVLNASEGRVTTNHSTNDTRQFSQTGSSSPEFQFRRLSSPNSSSGSLSLKDYQFGSAAEVTSTSPSSLSSADASTTSINSSNTGQNQPKQLNVYAREFVPRGEYIHQIPGIVSKGQGGVMGGYPIQFGLHPGHHPFIFPYNPMMFPFVHPDPLRYPPHQPLPLHTLGRPQIAVVAPYRAPLDTRPLSVSEKGFRDNKHGWTSSSESQEQLVQFQSSNDFGNARTTKSLSPPSASPSQSRRRSSTGDIVRTLDTDHASSDTPTIEADDKVQEHGTATTTGETSVDLDIPTVDNTIPDNVEIEDSNDILSDHEMAENAEHVNQLEQVETYINDTQEVVENDCSEKTSPQPSPSHSPSHSPTLATVHTVTSPSHSPSQSQSHDQSLPHTPTHISPTPSPQNEKCTNLNDTDTIDGITGSDRVATTVANTTDNVTTDSTDNVPTDSTDNVPTDSTDTVTTDSTDNVPTDVPIADVLTDGVPIDVCTGSPTDVRIADIPTLDSPTDVPTDSPTEDVPTEVPTDSSSKKHSKTCSVNDETTTSNQSSEDSTVTTNSTTSISITVTSNLISPVSASTTDCKVTNSSALKCSVRSWASVVGTSTNVALKNGRTQVQSQKPSLVSVGGASKASVGAVDPVVSKEEDEKLEEKKLARLKFLGSQIEDNSINHSPASILPRGLINSSSMCYIHAPLQALISCPEFTNLLRYLRSQKGNGNNDVSTLATIVTDSMIKFIGHFQPYSRPEDKLNSKRKKGLRDFAYERPFKPDFIYEILPKIKSTLSITGRHEDAEEFLGCFLNKLHDEMVAAKQSLTTPTTASETMAIDSKADQEKSGDEEEEWQEVGPKNKSTITRKVDYVESPISEIFGGKLHSSLHRSGMKVSATVEPFFSLQLDIQSDEVHTIKDALELLATKETVHLSDKDGVGAIRRVTLVELPPVLILHLKWFIFDGTKCRKLHKSINYDQDLEIPKDLLASSVKGKITAAQRSYRLWAVVSHSGETPNGGHYICEAYHPPTSGWLRYDDNYVKPIPTEQVYYRPMYRVPYLFFYRQVDTIVAR